MSSTAAATVQQYRPELTQYVSAMVGAGRAEDIVQDAYFRLSRALDSHPIENPRAYLFRIAANLARDELRRDKRVERHLREPPMETQSPAAGDIVARQEQLELLRAAVERLPEKCRRAFVARKYEGLSYREIAQREGIAEKTVENHIGRALKLLREDLISRLN